MRSVSSGQVALKDEAEAAEGRQHHEGSQQQPRSPPPPEGERFGGGVAAAVGGGVRRASLLVLVMIFWGSIARKEARSIAAVGVTFAAEGSASSSSNKRPVCCLLTLYTKKFWGCGLLPRLRSLAIPTVASDWFLLRRTKEQNGCPASFSFARVFARVSLCHWEHCPLRGKSTKNPIVTMQRRWLEVTLRVQAYYVRTCTVHPKNPYIRVSTRQSEFFLGFLGWSERTVTRCCAERSQFGLLDSSEEFPALTRSLAQQQSESTVRVRASELRFRAILQGSAEVRNEHRHCSRGFDEDEWPRTFVTIDSSTRSQCVLTSKLRRATKCSDSTSATTLFAVSV